MSRTSLRRLVSATALVFGTLATLHVPAADAAPVPSGVAVPKPAHSVTAAIEDYTPYVEQDDCDPHVKRGTARLGRLLATTYPRTVWYSARACVKGTTSEHYDGRAIDWMVSVDNPRQHRQGKAFLTWLLATDKYGDKYANARRLGVMYVIYDNRMWGMWDQKWEDYNGCEAKKMQKDVYDNACHRTHVHISLSWNGAHARTSFWTGHVSPTDYGPCRVKGHVWAPKWTHRNERGCPSPRH